MSGATIVSFMPIQLYEQKSGIIPPAYVIPAATDDRPGILVVQPASYFTYIDQDRGSLRSTLLAEDLARAICQDFANSQIGLEDDAAPGLCWFDGELQAGEVLAKHSETVKEVKRKHKNWYQSICRMADTDWARYHNHNAISDLQRLAGRSLGLDPDRHEWISISSSADQIICPVCKIPSRADAIVCATCRCVLDPEKYKQFTFAQ